MAATIKVEQGDCAEVLRNYPAGHFDLIVTSPPYADRRQHTYGGVKPERYAQAVLAFA